MAPIQLVPVRIPIPLAIVLLLALIAGIWWKETRHFDFMTPPTPEKLAEIKKKTELSLAAPPKVDDAIIVKGTLNPDLIQKPIEPSLPVEPPKPAIDPGNLSTSPTLDLYADQAFKGAVYMVELASYLETEGHLLRSHLAWERVLDSTKPEEEQLTAAVNALKRLQPSIAKWNNDPAKSTTIVIQAGTGKKITKKLKPILEQAAKNIETASSGLLKVKTNITVGKGQTLNQGATPVAIWFSGDIKDAPATEVLSFTAEDNDNLDLLTSQTLYSVLRSYFARTTLTPPPQAPENEPFLETLQKRVTRLTWERLGTALNAKPEPNH